MLTPGLLVADASLVSMGRFGATLHRARRRSEEPLNALSRRAGGRWLPDDLVSVERGVRALADEQVRELAWIYSLPMASWSARGAELVLDRSSVSDFSAGITASGTDLDTQRRDVARRAIALSVLIGRDVASGGPGLDALAAAAEVSPAAACDLIRDALADDPAALSSTVEQMAGRIAVPSSGIVVAETGAGALVLANRGTAERAWVPAAATLEDVVSASRGDLPRS